MIEHNSLDPRTAQRGVSIWQHISEDTFRRHLVALEERANAVPIQPQVFPLATSLSQDDVGARLLPVEVEQKLADDFAYITAVGEGAQSVAAACVEEFPDSQQLRIRFAAVDTISEQLRESLREVGYVLARQANDAPSSDDAVGVDDLLKLIVQQHFQKLLGRLRSAKWQKPKYLARTHKKSLWQDFDNLIHRVQFIYPKKKNTTRVEAEVQLRMLATVIRTFEETPRNSDEEFLHLLKIVRACYTCCRHPATGLYAAELERLPNATPQIAGAVKTLRQIEKVGAYLRIAKDMTKIAKNYPTLFSNLQFAYLSPYSAIETEIGFESWAKTLHVHAEVQLTIHYDLQRSSQKRCSECDTARHYEPRVIGTSKYLCYLCYQFIKHHGVFFPSNTHGRLYDQWTIPDLADYDNETREKYRQVIDGMNTEVLNLTNRLGLKQGKRDAWRVEPMTSRQNLLLDLINQPIVYEDHNCTTNNPTEVKDKRKS